MVKEVKDKVVIVKNDKGEIEEIPYGLLVWAAGNVSRQVTRDLMSSLPQHQTNRRGLLVDDYLRLLGANDVYAVGDVRIFDNMSQSLLLTASEISARPRHMPLLPKSHPKKASTSPVFWVRLPRRRRLRNAWLSYVARGAVFLKVSKVMPR